MVVGSSPVAVTVTKYCYIVFIIKFEHDLGLAIKTNKSLTIRIHTLLTKI